METIERKSGLASVVPIRKGVELKSDIATPITDRLILESNKLNSLSSYNSNFDFSIYKRLEKRFSRNPMRGGFIMGTAFRLANTHPACQQCLYAFEIDAYGRGCVHDCAYCYAKAELTVHGYWNNPVPVPININNVWKAFYLVFETDKSHKWRDVLSRKIPLRIGSMSDSFMWFDKRFKISQELLKILRYYKYPYIIFTRSDLVAEDEYLDLLEPSLCSMQFSISSTNKTLSRLIEPGAPSSKRRLCAAKKLVDAGIWTTVRINPLFPMYPDGYFSDPSFAFEGEIPNFPFSSFDIIDEISQYGIKSALAGFVRLSAFSINRIQKATGVDLRAFYRKNAEKKSKRDYHFSDDEIRYYYNQLKKRCDKYEIDFSTCYIGNGESHFWRDQDIWSNKSDCCNVKGNVKTFLSDCREIPLQIRERYAKKK